MVREIDCLVANKLLLEVFLRSNVDPTRLGIWRA